MTNPTRRTAAVLLVLLGASDVRLHLVPDGGRFDPATGRADLP